MFCSFDLMFGVCGLSEATLRDHAGFIQDFMSVCIGWRLEEET